MSLGNRYARNSWNCEKWQYIYIDIVNPATLDPTKYCTWVRFGWVDPEKVMVGLAWPRLRRKCVRFGLIFNPYFNP